MSEETKQLLLRLKKEKKVNKQIEIIQKLKEHNQEEMVNRVLIVHLERKDHDALRMEILNAINCNDDAIVKPLAQILNDKYEPLSVKEKVVQLLGENRGKKALGVLLSAVKKFKDAKLVDNISYALTFFEDERVIKPLIKALRHDELRLQALTGLARNETLLLGSMELIKELSLLEITKSFEKLHYEQIMNTIFDEFGYKDKDELIAAVKNKSIKNKINDYRKNQADIKKTLKKVSR
ncbi:MAG: HEAT repeat domain-containing protein [Candidatus Heimdallarchaeota archaeon]|nr:HEAT repeat domain-containing protein [Candidatus Heimdallarchaeota archaeon]MBY8994355.1 HEAT repeat domain-containing protein [Candidatus Heimdallarchaeota archaeon]